MASADDYERDPTMSRDVQELGAIFTGGAAGALARTLLARHVGNGAPAWPWATFAINVAGTFLLGYFATRLQERLPLSRYRRPLLGTGFCGAFTTFSTFQVELLKMIEAGRVGLAVAYAASSLAAGFAAMAVATAAVRRVRVL
jgi:CrcB protein